MTIKKSVLVISSHVIRGSVGSRGCVFALEYFGFPVWSMLTVSMTWQPDHGKSHRLNISEQDFQGWAQDILKSPWRHEIGAVLTGYFVSPEQVAIVADLINKLKEKNDDLLYVCDPVMGDEGGLYIREDTAIAVRDKLLPLADIAKPNRSELEWISNRKLDDNQAIIDAARSLKRPTVLITSAWPFLKNSTGNLLVTPDDAILAEHPLVDNPVNGLGDLTGTLFLVHLLNGLDKLEALRRTTASVYSVLQHTMKNGGYELLRESSLNALSEPLTHIDLRHIDNKKSIKKASSL